jgi:hypothetical protein
MASRRAIGGEGGKKASQKSEHSSRARSFVPPRVRAGSAKLLRNKEEWGIGKFARAFRLEAGNFAFGF